jgi:hypothetical protein
MVPPPSETRIEDFSTGEIRVGDETQQISILLTEEDPRDEIGIYVTATELTEANIGVDNLGIVAESRYAEGWLVSNADITKGDQITIHVTVTFDTEREIDDRGTVRIELTGLDTSNAEHNDTLNYSATISTSNGEPDFEAGRTTTSVVIDPEQLENVLRVSPSDIRIGEKSQDVDINIDRATDELDFRLDMSPLTAVGVNVENAEIVVEGTAGERRNDEGVVEIDVTETTVADGIVQLTINTTADTLEVNTKITGLDTDEADATTGMTYPIYVGERPPEPTESRQFRISGATA